MLLNLILIHPQWLWHWEHFKMVFFFSNHTHNAMYCFVNRQESLVQVFCGKFTFISVYASFHPFLTTTKTVRGTWELQQQKRNCEREKKGEKRVNYNKKKELCNWPVISPDLLLKQQVCTVKSSLPAAQWSHGFFDQNNLTKESEFYKN